MDNNIYKTAINNLPMFFDSQHQLDAEGGQIFDVIKKIVDFDEAYVFFLNPECIQLKYASTLDSGLFLDQVIPVNEQIKNSLFDPSSNIYSDSTPLVDLLNLGNNQSVLVSKLAIRNTVYGFILLCKKEKSFYNQATLEVMASTSAIVSYMIKDIELSNVFKIQIKALKDGIAETNEAYKTIKEQNLKILEADRIKNEFLANISHELRTPLNAIIGFSEVLSAKLFGDLNEKQTEYVKDIHVSGIHLLGMINEILDISKIEARAMTLNRRDFLISRAIDEVANVVKPLADKKNISIEKKIDQDGEVYADFQKISQILYNLLSNAIKFSDNDGKIFVGVEFRPNSFMIKIVDDGIGIDEKYYGKIFAKFVQLQSSYTKNESSTGLGLTITKELVEMHNGTIIVKSEVGKGTTFTVEIPKETPHEWLNQGQPENQPETQPETQLSSGEND